MAEKPYMDMSEKPYIVVTLGPTGSGKSGLIKNIIEYLGLSKEYVKILVDDIVENNQNYKDRILSIMEDVSQQCKSEKYHCEDSTCDKCDSAKYYLNPSDGLIAKFNAAYFDIRKSTKCDPYSKLTCDDINDKNLMEAILNRQNIVFEATGVSIPSWLLSAPYINDNYTIIFAYSIVTYDKLIERNIARTLQSITTFQQDVTKNPGPRLPELRHDIFKNIVQQTKEILIDLYNSCIRQHDIKKCGTQKIDRLLLFDNNESIMTLVYDSVTPTLSIHEFTVMVCKLFGIDCQGQKGGNKKHIKYHKKTHTIRTNTRNYKNIKTRRKTLKRHKLANSTIHK